MTEASEQIIHTWTERMGAHSDIALRALTAALSEHRGGQPIDIAERATDIGFNATAVPGWRERAVHTFNEILATLPTPMPGEH